jgi:ABC-type spermidine/putrescine transport system permease subunit I
VFTAKRAVTKLHEYDQLDEDKLIEFAHSLKLAETTVALSLLCALPVDVVERALVAKNREVILVLARALDLTCGFR